MRTPRAVVKVATFAAPVAVAALELPLLFPVPLVGDNFQFWAAGHMVVSGVSPYERSSWEAIAAYGPVPGGIAANTAALNLAITQQIWLYPPQTAFLFAPFGALPFEIGVPLLHLFGALATLAAVAVVAWLAGLRGSRLAFALTLALVSQPFVIAVRNGHPIGLLLVGGALLLTGLVARRDLPVALGVVLLTLKPQLVLPLAIFAVAYALARRDWRRLAVMLAAAAAVTIPAELLTPFPFTAVVAATEQRLAVDLSSIPAFARDLGGGTPLAIALTALTVAACGLAVNWAHDDVRPVVIGSSLFLLSVALVPYAHDYDLLLAVPAAFAVVALGAKARASWPASIIAALSLFIAPWLLFYWWPLAGESARRLQGGPLGAVPICSALALAAAAYLARRSAPDAAAVSGGRSRRAPARIPPVRRR